MRPTVLADSLVAHVAPRATFRASSSAHFLVACIQAVTVAVAGSCDRYWSDSVLRRCPRGLERMGFRPPTKREHFIVKGACAPLGCVGG